MVERNRAGETVAIGVAVARILDRLEVDACEQGKNAQPVHATPDMMRGVFAHLRYLAIEPAGLLGVTYLIPTKIPHGLGRKACPCLTLSVKPRGLLYARLNACPDQSSGSTGLSPISARKASSSPSGLTKTLFSNAWPEPISEPSSRTRCASSTPRTGRTSGTPQGSGSGGSIRRLPVTARPRPSPESLLRSHVRCWPPVAAMASKCRSECGGSCCGRNRSAAPFRLGRLWPPAARLSGEDLRS